MCFHRVDLCFFGGESGIFPAKTCNFFVLGIMGHFL